MNRKLSTATFTLLDRVQAKTTLRLGVVAVPRGYQATDAMHLRFAATYRTEQEARAAAFIGMARRTK